MRKLLLCWLAVCAASGVGAQNNEWQDAGINQVNRLPMHANFFAYESQAKAEAGDKRLSDRFLTLNGSWNFNWVCDADQRPTDFYRTDFNDKGWRRMNIPGLWEVYGYGDPIYLNIG